MPGHRPGRRLTLHVGAPAGQVANGVFVGHTHDILFNDGTLIKVLCHVVGGGPDELDTAILCLLVRAAPIKAGRKE